MSYAVQIEGGGYSGWKLLQRTGEAQRAAMEKTPQIQQSRDYFLSSFPDVGSVEDLLADYRLRKIVLTSFGLGDDVQNKAFIAKILESDLSDPKSLANRLNDKRYLALAQEMASMNGDPEANMQVAERIVNGFVDHIFEHSIGERDENIRLALNVVREIPKLASSVEGENAFWYSVLGSKPLRAVFDGAFGFPDSFGRLPIDRQLNEYKIKSEKILGSSMPDIFKNDDVLEEVVKNFFLRSQLMQVAVHTPYSAALSILTGGGFMM